MEFPPLQTPQSSPCTARSWQTEPSEGLVSVFTWASVKLFQKQFKESSTDFFAAWFFSCLFRWSYCLGSCPRVHMFEQILGLSIVAPKVSSLKHMGAWAPPVRFLSFLEASFFCTRRDHIDCFARRKKPLKHWRLCTCSASLPPARFVYITAKPSLSPTKYGHLIYREVKHDRSPPSCSISCIPPSLCDEGYYSPNSYCTP